MAVGHGHPAFWRVTDPGPRGWLRRELLIKGYSGTASGGRCAPSRAWALFFFSDRGTMETRSRRSARARHQPGEPLVLRAPFTDEPSAVPHGQPKTGAFSLRSTDVRRPNDARGWRRRGRGHARSFSSRQRRRHHPAPRRVPASARTSRRARRAALRTRFSAGWDRPAATSPINGVRRRSERPTCPVAKPLAADAAAARSHRSRRRACTGHARTPSAAVRSPAASPWSFLPLTSSCRDWRDRPYLMNTLRQLQRARDSGGVRGKA